MRLSTVFISSAFVLACMSAALSVEREGLVRFSDCGLSAEVEARAYDKELELYTRGTAPSKLTGGRNEANRNPIHRSASREPLLESGPNEDNRPQIYRSTSRDTSREPIIGSPLNRPKNYGSAPREPLLGSRPNSQPHPATSSDSRPSTTTRQRHIAKNYGHTGSPRVSFHSNGTPNVGGRRPRSVDGFD